MTLLNFGGVVENLSIASGMPMPKVYIIDDQLRNAFATNSRRIMPSLAQLLGFRQLWTSVSWEAVMAHEMTMRNTTSAW